MYKSDTLRLTPDKKWVKVNFKSIKKGNIFRFENAYNCHSDYWNGGIYIALTDYRLHHTDFKLTGALYVSKK